MAPLRFGLIGTGYWALHTHGTALSACRDAVLHGVWGRDPAKAQDVAQRLSAKAYEDLDQLLADVDAVAIALPPDIQAHIAVRAARAGCHLLLEKPLALDVASAEAVAAAVQEAGVATLVFFTSRFRPEVERWTQAAADAGPWHSAHLVHYANIFEPSGPYATSVWRREYGALWDVGPHGLAALLPIMGPVASVAARSGPAGSDTVHLILSHADPGQPAPRELAIEVAALDALETVADVGTLSESATTALPPLSPLAVELTAGPACMSTMSLSLTMPPAAAASQLSIYGDHGVRSRPEASFDVVEVFRSAVAELAMLVRTGERAHSCDVGFGLEVVRALAAAERAMDLPGIDLG